MVPTSSAHRPVSHAISTSAKPNHDRQQTSLNHRLVLCREQQQFIISMEQPKTRTAIIRSRIFQHPATTNESAIGFRRYGFSAAETDAAGFRATKDRAGQVSEFDLMAGPIAIEA
jgi:hypothetical protein